MEYTLSMRGDPADLAAMLLHAAEIETGSAAPTDVEPEPVAEPTPAPAAEPEPEPHAGGGIASLEDIRRAVMGAINAGKREEVRQLLGQHGAARVPDLTDGERPAFLAEVEAL